MKKRFTIMLDESTIWALKKLAAKRSPIGHREELERVLWQYACEELNSNLTIDEYREMMRTGKLPYDK